LKALKDGGDLSPGSVLVVFNGLFGGVAARADEATEKTTQLWVWQLVPDNRLSMDPSILLHMKWIVEAASILW
jgi:hypothetical protein